MTTQRQQTASPSTFESVPGQLLPAARAVDGLVPLALARCRVLRARQMAGGDGGALARRADGDLRGKQTPVTSSPRPANSEGAQSPELSGRGPFAVRELVS